MDVNTVCRLCLGGNRKLLDVFASCGIQGLTAADAILELLQIQVTVDDTYPHCVCIECLKILIDFKLFKQRCECNKDLLDRAYARKLQHEPNEELMGMSVPCDAVIKEEEMEILPNEPEKVDSAEFEDYVYDFYEKPSDKLIESANTDTMPIKCENEDHALVQSDQINVPHSSSVKKLNENIPEVHSSCANIVHSDHSMNEGVLYIKEESYSDGSFKEDIPRDSKAELTTGENYNTGYSEEKKLFSYMCGNTSNAHSSGPQNDHGGPIGVSGLSRVEDIIINEDMVSKLNHISSQTKIYLRSVHVSQKAGSEKKLIMPPQCNDDILVDDNAFECMQCFEKFPTSECLRSHMLIHSEEPLQSVGRGMALRQKRNLKMDVMCSESSLTCNESFSDKIKSSKCTTLPSEKRCFKCTQCSKSFSHKGHLNVHLRIHSGERPFECDHCSKSFTRKNVLGKHMTIHSGKRPFKCDECSDVFPCRSALRKHKRIHSGERPFKCDQCSDAFSRKSVLKDHERIHSGERPYKCVECSKSFTQKGTLTKHIMRVHCGERPFE